MLYTASTCNHQHNIMGGFTFSIYSVFPLLLPSTRAVNSIVVSWSSEME